MAKLSALRDRAKHIEVEGRDCCENCLHAPQVKMRMEYDGKTWTGDARVSDQSFTIVASSAKHLVKKTIPARAPLPELGGPGWIEGIAIRDVC